LIHKTASLYVAIVEEDFEDSLDFSHQGVARDTDI
jgi:hypothetical protein